MASPEMSGQGPTNFPTTHWSQLAAARGPMTPEHREVLNCLILRYWSPVHAYICRRGFRNEAADLTQDFFIHSLREALFGRADRARGRFRPFLLRCLNNFLADAARHRKRHNLPEGVVSVHQLSAERGPSYEPAETETPEDVFYRAWVRELLNRVFSTLQQDFAAAGQQAHGELFRRRVFDPILSGTEPPSMETLAGELGLPWKQACNYLVTARRAFQRLLREEIGVYASSEEEIASEVRELFRFAGGA
ncbi:MAG: sigma-70 family RNA polymerase sigma factor [Pirellulales bacterium]|nr:sigma-70 family RNA polymerase sigma factor [Pirellulales bacterium]